MKAPSYKKANLPKKDLGGYLGAGISGAISLGSAGAALGPVGMAAGAGVGLLKGLFGFGSQSSAIKEAQRIQREQSERQIEETRKANDNAVLGSYDTFGVNLPLYKKGGKIDEKYDRWFRNNTREGKAGLSPNDPNLDYDYQSFYNDMISGKTSYVDPDSNEHYPDAYKLPNHSSFSVESNYYTNPVEQPNVISWDGNFNKPMKRLAAGGFIPQYEVEKGEVVQGQGTSLEEGTPIASDLMSVGGNTHAQGGTLGAGGERVFSDKLKVSDGMIDILDAIGIKVKGTYGNAAKTLGNKKGKLEEKLDSKFSPAINTAKRNLPMLEGALDFLFLDQESNKPSDNKTPKMALGGVTPITAPNYTNNQLGNGTIPISAPVIPEMGLSDRLSILGSNVGNTLGNVGNFLNRNSGTLLNIGNFLLNRSDINNLDVSVPRRYIPAPTYNYVDRSGPAREDNRRIVRSGIRALGSSSSTVNASNTAALIAAGLEGANRISAQENIRRDSYNENFSNRADRINAMNSGIYNEAMDTSRTLNNQRNVILPQQNRMSFLQGVLGNQAVNQQRRNDATRAKLSAVLNDDKGVLTRAASRLGYDNLDEFINDVILSR